MHAPTFSSSSFHMNVLADARKSERRGYQFVILSNQAPVYSWYPSGVLNTPHCTHDILSVLNTPWCTHGIPHCTHVIAQCTEHLPVYCTDIIQGVYLRSSLVRISFRKNVRTSYGVSTCSSQQVFISTFKSVENLHTCG